jgi:hypothetical protein
MLSNRSIVESLEKSKKNLKRYNSIEQMVNQESKLGVSTRHIRVQIKARGGDILQEEEDKDKTFVVDFGNNLDLPQLQELARMDIDLMRNIVQLDLSNNPVVNEASNFSYLIRTIENCR